MLPLKTTLALYDLVAAIFDGALMLGMTIVAGICIVRAAKASAWAWLPYDFHMSSVYNMLMGGPCEKRVKDREEG